MIHSLHGGGDSREHYCGLIALSTTIGTPESSVKVANYVMEDPPRKYHRKKIALYLHTFITIGLLALGFLHQTESTNSFSSQITTVIFDDSAFLRGDPRRLRSMH